MENIENVLPAIPEDYDKSFTIDGKWFPDIQKYKPLMKVFYVKEKRNISDFKISRVTKKQLLLNILKNQNNLLNNTFLLRLKQILTEGLCYSEICTDSEYELLKKEFKI